MSMFKWKGDIHYSLIEVAKARETFTNDDVFDYFTEHFGYWHEGSNIDNRAFGPIIQRALKSGIMEWTGQSVVTRRPQCKSMLVKVWRSKLYKPSLWTRFKTWFNNTF